MINSNVILEINTKNLVHNFNTLSKIANSSILGATIKANAYGIGDQVAFKVLYKNSCRHFFFATFNEALLIRKKFFKANIYVLNGLEGNNLRIFDKYK